MILLLGASGYMGRAFAVELRRRGHSFVPLTRGAFDYTRFDFLFDYLRTMKPQFLINAAGYATSPGEDALETAREKAMLANALLPQMIARACLMTKTPWGHISSGSIYTGGIVVGRDSVKIERDLGFPEMRELFESHPERFRGFTELDEPNFSFRHPPCSFYSGTKALAEEAIREIGQSYIWRTRLPFGEEDEPCNYLHQLRRAARLPNTIDSLSHLEDCARACVELWEMRAPYGIYNVTNPGAVSTRRIVELMERGTAMRRRIEAWRDDPASQQAMGKAPESHCILDVGKLVSMGVKIRPVMDALEAVLGRWRSALRMSKTLGEHSPRPPSVSP